MSNIIKKVLKAYQEERLLFALKLHATPCFYGLKYVIHDPAYNLISLYCPDYVEPTQDSNELEIVERIFQSFRKMKEDQEDVSDIYRPSSVWQKQLDNSYSYLTEGLIKNDINRFHFFYQTLEHGKHIKVLNPQP